LSLIVDALQKWTEVNSIAKVQRRSKDNSFHNQNYQSTGGRALTSRDSEVKCIYCESVEHKAISCDKVTNTNERKFSLKNTFVLTALLVSMQQVTAKAKFCAKNARNDITLPYVHHCPK
jgi:hypothetical protein